VEELQSLRVTAGPPSRAERTHDPAGSTRVLPDTWMSWFESALLLRLYVRRARAGSHRYVNGQLYCKDLIRWCDALRKITLTGREGC
jgi:hypothetical protein